MENKGWKGNFFEDFALEQELDCPVPRTVTSGDISTYIALTGDRTPVYCGPTGYVHPLVTFHVVFGQTVRQISLNARANLGYAGIKWKKPVKLGDTLKMRLKIVGLKENSSGKTGIVWVENVATNQNDEEVLTFYRWVMIKKKGSEPTKWADDPVIPEMPDQVDPSELVVNEEAIPTLRETGSQLVFEDYEAGERILHYDGMAVNHSDHMSFTRLFQNSSKVHFDAKMMDGKPLIYGGVPISLGYAMSFNGLQNRVGICGINAGSHTAPLYSGDTVYAFTDVIETAELDNDNVGALRLRLVCMKNIDPAKLDDPQGFELKIDHPDKPGRKKYNDGVILDLDYWDLVPTKAGFDA
jgi:2-methylfumaryl-CoA hydratase